MELEEAIRNLKDEINVDKNNLPIAEANEYEEERTLMLNRIEAKETILTHLTKQDKMIDKMAKALHLFIWKNDEKIMITPRPKVNCHTLSIEEIKQYFEKKAEE